jgi:gluconolactonase
VYRVETDGKVVEVTHEVEKPNGLALSPDGKTLYLADHNNGTDRIMEGVKSTPGAMKVYAFPLNAEGLVGGPRKTLVDFGDQAGCDGMTVDSKGNVYLTARGLKRPGVLVIDPTGKEVAFIPTGAPNQSPDGTPVGIPSNVTFGRGAESKMLYVTIDLSLYRIPLKVEGFHIDFK